MSRRSSSDVYYVGEVDEENERSIIKGEHKHRWDYLSQGLTEKTRCGDCGLFIAEHQGCYACCGCDYAEAVHKLCADLPRIISGHPVLSIDNLRLETRMPPPPGTLCCYCQEALQGLGNDPYYSCAFLFYMHATCALIPLPVIRGECEYFCHQRRMLLLEDNGGAAAEEEEDSACFSCGSRWRGGQRVYRCAAVPHCKNFFHRSCAELPRRINHPLHFVADSDLRQHPYLDHPDAHHLVLTIGRPETCGACRRRGCRHVYYCESKEDDVLTSRRRRRTISKVYNMDSKAVVLGAECVFGGNRLAVTSHKHGLLLVEDRPADALRCDACRGISRGGGGAVPSEVRRTGDMSFRCEHCVFNLHFLCGPLPSEVEFELHVHPLRLVNQLLVEDDSGEYYCDVCEEERDIRFRVYHCADCKFVAHVHCLLSEIMKLLKDERNTNVEFMILGESSLHGSMKTDNELLEAREGTLTLTEEENPTEELSFLDIVYRLTDEERERLDFPSSSTDHEIILSRGLRFIASFLDRNNKGPEIEYVDVAEEFFHLDSTEFSELCLGFSHLKHEKPLLELDKYLSMKVLDVGGYMVPWDLASDLKMLLRKYGDLGRDSSLTPQMKSITATLLCAVVYRMGNTMAEDMSVDDLKNWYYNLNRIKNAADYKVTELECFEESVMTTFLGYEAIRFEKEANKSLDLKIAKLEAELEDCKGKREKFKECASTKSDFIKECMHKASGSKWKTVDKLF